MTMPLVKRPSEGAAVRSLRYGYNDLLNEQEQTHRSMQRQKTFYFDPSESNHYHYNRENKENQLPSYNPSYVSDMPTTKIKQQGYFVSPPATDSWEDKTAYLTAMRKLREAMSPEEVKF